MNVDWSVIQTHEGRAIIQALGVFIGLSLGAWLWSKGKSLK